MLEPLREAARALGGGDNGHRRARVAELRLVALAALHRSPNPADAARAPVRTVQQALAEVEAADRQHLLPDIRARLWRARAQAHAALGDFRQAYGAQEQAQALMQSARALSRDTQVLSLQARYDGARREAENAQLRHREEAARLALQVQSARQRLLWAALAALGLLAALTAVLLWRALARRRTMAALALRDELTGAPNRRAVAAYAQRCLQQRGEPPVLALIDLDHFKRVNDEHGHAVGDALLRALVAAAALELRAQDRMGRWGGEEWLLVLPGAGAQDLPKVFRRLRRRFAQQVVPGLPQPHGVTFSMGAALPAGRDWGLDDALEAADRALYRAKAAGRDRLELDDGDRPGGPAPHPEASPPRVLPQADADPLALPGAAAGTAPPTPARERAAA
jgi:diguanylate cyclase (GGDEF)-like protein